MAVILSQSCPTTYFTLELDSYFVSYVRFPKHTCLDFPLCTLQKLPYASLLQSPPKFSLKFSIIFQYKPSSSFQLFFQIYRKVAFLSTSVLFPRVPYLPGLAILTNYLSILTHYFKDFTFHIQLYFSMLVKLWYSLIFQCLTCANVSSLTRL